MWDEQVPSTIWIWSLLKTACVAHLSLLWRLKKNHIKMGFQGNSSKADINHSSSFTSPSLPSFWVCYWGSQSCAEEWHGSWACSAAVGCLYSHFDYVEISSGCKSSGSAGSHSFLTLLSCVNPEEKVNTLASSDNVSCLCHSPLLCSRETHQHLPVGSACAA